MPPVVPIWQTVWTILSQGSAALKCRVRKGEAVLKPEAKQAEERRRRKAVYITCESEEPKVEKQDIQPAEGLKDQTKSAGYCEDVGVPQNTEHSQSHLLAKDLLFSADLSLVLGPFCGLSAVPLLGHTPLPVGLKAQGGVMINLIERNMPTPVTKSQVFTTYADNQPAVRIQVFEGDCSMAKGNNFLGEFIFDEIFPSPRGAPQIEVELNINTNGILCISARDQSTGKTMNCVLSAARTSSADKELLLSKDDNDDEEPAYVDDEDENEDSDFESDIQGKWHVFSQVTWYPFVVPYNGGPHFEENWALVTSSSLAALD